MQNIFKAAVLLITTMATLSSCKKDSMKSNTGSQGIHFKIDGTQYDLTYNLTVTATQTSDSIHVMAFDSTGIHYGQFFIITQGGKTGIYTSTTYTADQGGTSFGFDSYAAAAFWKGSSITYNLTSYSTTTLSSEGDANVQGTFSGKVLNNDNTLHALTDGTFNIHQ